MSRHVYRIRPKPEFTPAILLRESYREDGKVRKRTLCNLSDWPAAHIEGLRGVLKGGTVIAAATIAQNTIVTAITPNYPLTMVTRPTPTRQKTFQLLGLSCSQQRQLRSINHESNSTACAISVPEAGLKLSADAQSDGTVTAAAATTTI